MAGDTAITPVPVYRVKHDGHVVADMDGLAAEEPLEIRLGFVEDGRATRKSISITMRTPGEDLDLAAGFLFTEGLITSPAQIQQIGPCGMPAPGSTLHNTVRVDLCADVTLDLTRLERHFYTSSSCGVCGKTSIAALDTGACSLAPDAGPMISPETIHRLPGVLRARQAVFARTGGLHAAALFSPAGEIECLREDVGRHNALDKLIGSRFLAGSTPLSAMVLLVSGRASFELVQKALMAGIPILAAIGAPSSLAVELAREYGMTLVGFVRENRFNIYSGAQRVAGIDIVSRNAGGRELVSG